MLPDFSLEDIKTIKNDLDMIIGSIAQSIEKILLYTDEEYQCENHEILEGHLLELRGICERMRTLLDNPNNDFHSALSFFNNLEDCYADDIFSDS
jgi:hypothetical protein